MGLTPPYSIDTIVLYLEFLAQKNFKACSLRNNVSVLKHFFALFNWPLAALSCRKVQLLLKSVQMNARMNIKVKGVISISMLQKLIKIVQKCYNGVTYKALFLMAYFGFFRLASLVPPTTGSFDKTRYFTVNDVVWGQPGAHIIVTCAKNMQNSGQYHVVQLPQLKNVLICPVLALKNMLKKKDITPHQPLFQIHTKKGIVPLIASNARSFLKTCIATMGLNPSVIDNDYDIRFLALSTLESVNKWRLGAIKVLLYLELQLQFEQHSVQSRKMSTFETEFTLIPRHWYITVFTDPPRQIFILFMIYFI